MLADHIEEVLEQALDGGLAARPRPVPERRAAASR